MKKLATIILLVLVIVLAGCTGKAETGDETTGGAGTTAPDAVTTLPMTGEDLDGPPDDGITSEKLAEMVTGGEIPADVRELDLSDNYIGDISPLKSLKNLTKLDLSKNYVTILDPLEELTALEWLHVGSQKTQGPYGVTDITPLKGMVKLTYLNLRGQYWLVDISPLKELVSLTELDLSDSSMLRDYSVLAGLTNLIKLNLENQQISDISFLKGLVNLTELNLCLYGSEINDISPIKELKNLKELILPQINDAQKAELATALPDCNILYAN